MSNPSATCIKRAKTQRAAHVDVNKGALDINESDIEEVPRGKPSNSTTTSGTNLLSVFPPQQPFRVVKRATSSKAIVLSSDSLSEPSSDDYQPAKESQDAQDDDMDMEGSEIVSRKSSIGVIDSEYVQDLSLCKHKVKWSQVGDPKQKTSAMPSDSKDQASKQSRMMTSKVQKAHGTSSRKVGHHIPSSPTHVLSNDAGPQKDTHSNGPCNKSTNTVQVVLIGSDSTRSTVTLTPAQGVPQTNVSDPHKESSKTMQAHTPSFISDSFHCSTMPTSAQQSARSDEPDPRKESVNTVKALVAPLTSNPMHCTTAHIDSNNMSVPIAFINVCIAIDYCF